MDPKKRLARCKKVAAASKRASGSRVSGVRAVVATAQPRARAPELTVPKRANVYFMTTSGTAAARRARAGPRGRARCPRGASAAASAGSRATSHPTYVHSTHTPRHRRRRRRCRSHPHHIQFSERRRALTPRSPRAFTACASAVGAQTKCTHDNDTVAASPPPPPLAPAPHSAQRATMRANTA